jgi:hypothetical protein
MAQLGWKGENVDQNQLDDHPRHVQVVHGEPRKT